MEEVNTLPATFADAKIERKVGLSVVLVIPISWKDKGIAISLQEDFIEVTAIVISNHKRSCV